MDALVPAENTIRPPVYNVAGRNELHVAVASLALGGAERIVLDWASRIYPRWRVHLIVLRNQPKEWRVPEHVRVTRLAEDPACSAGVTPTSAHRARLDYLRELGKAIAVSNNPVCVCHLLSHDERAALGEAGATIVAVLHNAKDGWREQVRDLNGDHVVAVSEACRDELRAEGYDRSVSVIRHIPPRRKLDPHHRDSFRAQWRIPHDALVVGMVGAVKAQKNYRRALRIFTQLLARRGAQSPPLYLAIVGGPINLQAEGKAQWQSLIDDIDALGLRGHVALPGFVPDAATCLPAFDLMLNSSDFEGLSIATLEALQAGLPVVASKVGGQGEIPSQGLTLVAHEADNSEWVAAIEQHLGSSFDPPPWSQFPSYRLWTLCSLVRPVVPNGKTLFVTANLNSGGAQRSLVNLASELAGSMDFEVAVAGESTTSYFYRQLSHAGVGVERTSDDLDAFSHAEALVHKICREQIGTVCLWNVDRRVKLLLSKALESTAVRLIDVSPGGYAFEELDEVSEFQRLIAYTSDDYYRRLDTLVLKYDGPYPALCEGKVIVIRNGVPAPARAKSTYTLGNPPRVVVNGRIAPSKFITNIIEAVALVREVVPDTELNIFGAAEPREAEYLRQVESAARRDLPGAVTFHGVDFEAVGKLAGYDAYVVLGKHQGCPNALLEALCVGLPVVANDDGGTREQVIDGQTGVLLPDCQPRKLADALIKVLRNRSWAQELGEAGRTHVQSQFSMREMAERYRTLLLNK